MNSDFQKPENRSAAVEDALRTYPIASQPASLTADVMRRIAAVEPPRFRITSQDLILVAVLALASGAAVFGFLVLPSPVFVKLHIQSVLLWQSVLVHSRWLLPLASILTGLGLGAAALWTLSRQSRTEEGV